MEAELLKRELCRFELVGGCLKNLVGDLLVTGCCLWTFTTLGSSGAG